MHIIGLQHWWYRYFVIDRARDQQTEYRQNLHGEVLEQGTTKGQESSPLVSSGFRRMQSNTCRPIIHAHSSQYHTLKQCYVCLRLRLFALSTHFRFLSLNYAISHPPAVARAAGVGRVGRPGPRSEWVLNMSTRG